MGLNRIDYPANLTTQADFSQHSELIETRFLDQVTPPLQVVAGVIPQGVVLQIGGAVYRSDSDTTITGTPSDYVRVTPDGATATAAYVSTLAGVSWAKQYAGYYDGSGNLYLFDEGKALAAGDIASVFGRYLAQQENGDVRVGRDLSVGNDLTVTDGATVGGTLNAAIVDTGNGATEIFDMNQDLRTDDDVTFATVNARGMDTFGGFYRGSNSLESNLPVGSIVLITVDSADGGPFNLNSSLIINIGSNTNYNAYGGDYYGSLAGTWRCRGSLLISDKYGVLMQRVS